MYQAGCVPRDQPAPSAGFSDRFRHCVAPCGGDADILTARRVLLLGAIGGSIERAQEPALQIFALWKVHQHRVIGPRPASLQELKGPSCICCRSCKISPKRAGETRPEQLQLTSSPPGERRRMARRLSSR